MAERGDGAVGGIKSKDIEHLVGFKMGWSATPKEGVGAVQSVTLQTGSRSKQLYMCVTGGGEGGGL